ncbi:MAG: diacylglycerol kinase family lipid kinase [Candidatus Aminicenantes bacterium]|nr:diacylglycerol kinase family lipid kinase [Candidatus Aminicenantes bacterium]
MIKQKTQVIVNPASDQGRTRGRWREIKEALKTFIREFHYEFTEKPLQAIDLTRQAIKNGTELVIGVGGDGTLNEIANGFFEENKIINPETELAIVPSGTGCDFMRSLNLPTSLKKALQILSKAVPRRVDVGRVTYLNQEGKKEQRFFLNVADFGVGGEVVHEVNRKRLERKASSYFRTLITTMISYRPKRIKLKINDLELPENDYLIGAVANGRIFGKGMKIAPTAEIDDGLFDLILIRGMKFFEFLKNSWKIFTGSHLSHPKTSLWKACWLEAQPIQKEKVILEIDGEEVGYLPATFEIIPAQLLIKAKVQS